MKTLLVAALTLSIAACSSAQIQSGLNQFNSTVAADLPTACATITEADTSFKAAAASGGFKKSTIAKEAQAMAAAASICANPAAVNAQTALQTLATAYAAVLAQTKGQ